MFYTFWIHHLLSLSFVAASSSLVRKKITSKLYIQILKYTEIPQTLYSFDGHGCGFIFSFISQFSLEHRPKETWKAKIQNVSPDV